MFLGYNFKTMLKRLAIVVLFAIVLPIYGQKESSQSGSSQDHSNGTDKPPLPPPRTATCVVKQEGTTIECNWSEAKSGGYFKRLASPENAPNIGLFLAGLLGIGVAIFTLQAINKQAALMAEQNKTVRDRERARISTLEPTKPEFKPAGSFFGNKNDVPVLIRIPVINDSDTRAFNVGAVGMLRIDPNSDGKFNPNGIRLDIPKIIRPGIENPVQLPVTGMGTIVGTMTSEVTLIPEALADDVREGRKSLRTMGVVFYEDVFGGSHETPFNYLWEVPAYVSTGEWVEGCHWIDQSPPST